MALTTPTVTGYSAFWANLLSPTHGADSYSMDQSKVRAKGAYVIAKLMNRGGMRDARGALAALIGAAAGGTALNQYVRRKSPVGPSATAPTVSAFTDFSGNIQMTTVDAINRATTAADVTELKKWFAQGLLESGVTYPTVTGPNANAGPGRFA